jgi:hypothetical protein
MAAEHSHPPPAVSVVSTCKQRCSHSRISPGASLDDARKKACPVVEDQLHQDHGCLVWRPREAICCGLDWSSSLDALPSPTWQPTDPNASTEDRPLVDHTRRCLLRTSDQVRRPGQTLTLQTRQQQRAAILPLRKRQTQAHLYANRCFQRFRARWIPTDSITVAAKTCHERPTQRDTTSTPHQIRKQAARQLPTRRTTFAPTHRTPPSRRHDKSVGHHGRRKYNRQGDSVARTRMSTAEGSHKARRRFQDAQR